MTTGGAAAAGRTAPGRFDILQVCPWSVMMKREADLDDDGDNQPTIEATARSLSEEMDLHRRFGDSALGDVAVACHTDS